MALATYADLQISVAAWLNREDLASRVPDFVALAHADLNRKLRVQEMVALATGSATAAVVDLPDDCLEVVYITLGDDGVTGDLRPVSLTELKKEYDLLPEAGPPSVYALRGNTFHLARWAEAVAYAIVYYQAIPALSADDDTNWLLTSHPDAYLYGALAHSAPFLVEDERLPTWIAGYTNAVESLNARNQRQQFAAPMSRRGRR